MNLTTETMQWLNIAGDDNNNEAERTPSVTGFGGKRWEVHKFGGTSVANAECFLRAASIVEEQLGIRPGNNCGSGHNDLNLAVVISAMGGKPKVTDLLLSTVTAASKRDTDLMESILEEIRTKHATCIDTLFPSDPLEAKRLQDIIESDMNGIRDILKTVSLMKWQAKRISELVSGYGELWSSQILCSLLTSRSNERFRKLREQSSSSLFEEVNKHHVFVYLDARRIITIDEDVIKDGAVCWDICQEKLKQVYAEEEAKLQQSEEEYDEDYMLHFVMTGYVASNTDGVATTLQRDGSDYSAAILGRLLLSRNVCIWTDVDGVLSADPRRVPSAHVIPEVSYNEAMELAYFGTKVIHPKTMQPAISAYPQIPIYIRNTFNSGFPGTCVHTSSTTHTDREKCICGFASVEHMALINVEGSGLIGVPGAARRVFGTLEKVGVNVVLISQASSEHSITFATLEKQAEAAKTALEEEFHKDIRENRVEKVDVQAPCSIVAAVGDGMSATAGVSGRFFSALGDAKINVLAISQGLSERNISAVVMTSESTRALRAVHAAFRLSHAVVRVGIVGMGELGVAMVDLLEAQRNKLRNAYDMDLQVCAIVPDGTSPYTVKLKYDGDGCTGSITMRTFDLATDGSLLMGAPAYASSSSVSFDESLNGDTATRAPGGLPSLLKYLFNDECGHHVIFDCTAEEAVGKLHAEWLRAGVHIITANNTGLSGSREQREAISDAETMLGKLSAHYLRGVTVGGGLPVVSTLRSLLNSGDKIRRVDGILSVSLSFIMFRISPPPGITECSEFDELLSQGAFHGDLSISPRNHVGEACSFSEAVKEAVALGLMEENPEKDVNNEYTARVLMVLAKELGLDEHYDTVDIQKESDKLVEGVGADYESFTFDESIMKRVKRAEKRGCVLRHICSVDVKSKRIEIKIVEVPNHHVFAVTPPSCECVRFFTQRHRRYPLIIQGPSSGIDSTASALLAELLTLMRSKVGPRSGALSKTGSGAFLV